MKVLVDTSIWSVVLRKQQDQKIATMLQDLIQEFRVSMIGPVRQELLSGIRDKTQFKKLKDQLAHFPDHLITTEMYELAAQNFNTCRAKGIQGSHIDFLICSVAMKEQWVIFTLDKDFQHYAQHLPIQLLKP